VLNIKEVFILDFEEMEDILEGKRETWYQGGINRGNVLVTRIIQPQF
jgi:hypothetical protein